MGVSDTGCFHVLAANDKGNRDLIEKCSVSRSPLMTKAAPITFNMQSR